MKIHYLSRCRKFGLLYGFLAFLLLGIFTIFSGLSAQADTFVLGLTNLVEGPSAGRDSIVLGASSITSAWTNSANDSWLHLDETNESGEGSTNIVFTFDTNTGDTRTGSLTIAGQTATVTQAAVTYASISNYLSFLTIPPFVTTPKNQAGNVQNGMTLDEAGNLYFVYAASPFSGVAMVVPTNNSLMQLISYPNNVTMGVVSDHQGNLYYASGDSGTNVLVWNLANSNSAVVISNGLIDASTLNMDGFGNLYILDYSANCSVKKWVPTNGTLSTVMTNLGGTASMAVDAAGNVYNIFYNAGNYISKWNASTGTETVLFSNVPGDPNRLAVDGSGNLYATGLQGIYEFNVVNGTTNLLATNNGFVIGGIICDKFSHVYIGGGPASQNTNPVRIIPHAFLPGPKSESAAAGADQLAPVLPAALLNNPNLFPKSDQTWLTIAGVANGAVNFNFTANTAYTNRTAHINLLGQNIAVTQSATLIRPLLTDVGVSGDGSFQFAFSNNVTGASFTVYSSTDLALARSNWTPVSEFTNSPAGQLQFSIPLATNEPSRYYYVRSP